MEPRVFIAHGQLLASQPPERDVHECQATRMRVSWDAELSRHVKAADHARRRNMHAQENLLHPSGRERLVGLRKRAGSLASRCSEIRLPPS